MVDMLKNVQREPRVIDGGVVDFVYVSDPMDGIKPLGFIRRIADFEWQATPAAEAAWWFPQLCMNDREAIMYLIGYRGGRFAQYIPGELVRV